jgi:hypothetical protein
MLLWLAPTRLVERLRIALEEQHSEYRFKPAPLAHLAAVVRRAEAGAPYQGYSFKILRAQCKAAPGVGCCPRAGAVARPKLLRYTS